ncbi:MAG: rRNA pseudouridine synthase, partial [Burkholderiales bacterium]
MTAVVADDPKQPTQASTQGPAPGDAQPGREREGKAPGRRRGRTRGVFQRRRGVARKGAEGEAGAEAPPGGARTGSGADDGADEDPVPFFARRAAFGLQAAAARRRGPPRARAEEETPKLHKVLADAGLGSRRDMEELIVAGRVSVNGQPAHIGQRIAPGDQVRVNGKPIKRRVALAPPRVLLYHKPAGEMVTRDDPGERATVFERLPRLKGARWVTVGRLDFNTEGLLVCTTSGEMANKLMHPRYGWEREYAVRVLGRLGDEARQSLVDGIELEDGTAAFASLEEIGGDGANVWYRVTIGEGRNREVRRMFEAVGLTVSRLVRIRYGPVALPRGLRRGRWIELSESEVAALQSAMRQAEPRPAKGNDGPGDEGTAG